MTLWSNMILDPLVDVFPLGIGGFPFAMSTGGYFQFISFSLDLIHPSSGKLRTSSPCQARETDGALLWNLDAWDHTGW